MRDELLGLLSAGHETTATSLAWAAERLSRNPEVQERLSAELQSDDDSYLNAVTNETMRCRPPVINGVRSALHDTHLGGYLIPAGTPVAAMFSLAQRQADLWERPLEFRPERFLEGNPAPYTFTPFGGGLRRCIGAPLATSEFRIVLETLVRGFRLSSAPIPAEKMKLIGPTLAPSAGAQLILKRRPEPIARLQTREHDRSVPAS